MNTFLVFEIRIWLFLVLLLIGLLLLAGAAYLAWRWLQRREARLVAENRRTAERDALTRRNRMLIRLDHELKNPLTALRTSAATVREMIRDDSPNPDEIAPVVRQIDTSARRVARLLADLRKLADVESRTIEFTRVDMDRLIHQAVEDARTAPGAEDRMIVATVARAPWKLPDVAGEEDLLLSAILNLLGNAIKYSADTDVVELRANEQIIRNHRWVVVEVADTGQGIPSDEQDTVWDELSRGKRVRSVAGSGMGLSLVRSIIARHGGSVELFSQEGVGTSVRLVLPVLGDAQAPGAPHDDGAQAAAASAPVQPFNDSSRGGGAGGFLPPRQPSEAELDGRILGTPRRTSKRRLQRVNGELHDSATGETFGDQVPFDSGPYQHFKPPRPAAPPPQPMGSGPQQHAPGPQDLGPGQQNVGSVPQQYGSGPQNVGSGPQQYGSGPVGPGGPGQAQPYQQAPAAQPYQQGGSEQRAMDRAPMERPAPAPQHYGSAPHHYGSAPQQYGSAPQQGGPVAHERGAAPSRQAQQAPSGEGDEPPRDTTSGSEPRH